ncbi:TniQ family protein [Streptomyces sp. PKU-MA01144]|uniref:TniQ family protein n=1 Tax=Streptomyces sp. PKU-MA01144 TaxID=2729138 RepID=UPI00147A814B|nr:TniQ family protein [Streptomyces sp. PKU-MA01144]NNJ05636.1 TniQ family protein [Streptomyces sp. PKU-MA01144]
MPTSPRRLALVPEPHSGESLLSWVDALARLNQVSRLHALRLAGFARPDAAGYRPTVYFGAYLTAETTTRVQAATGLSAGRQREMLAHYADSVLPRFPLPRPQRTAAIWLTRLRLALTSRSRACPACLRENGGRWLLRWRLVWSFACVRHRLYLLSACRSCGKGLHQLNPGPADAVVCGQYDRSRQTRTCLRVVSRMRAPRLSDPHLLQCQRRLDHLIDHPHDGGGRDILRSLHVAMEDIHDNYDDAPPLPDTDAVLHRRWHGHGGALWYRNDPLLTAALVKIATAGGLAASQDTHAQADTASWSTLLSPGTGAPPANRFGGTCRATACATWVPPGQGHVVKTQVLCPAHADHVITPGSTALIPQRFT